MPTQNIIWIFGDQHRAQALGGAGDSNVRTPHIDRLASQGVTFTNAVSGCPWCAPFRGSLLTSRYVHECVERTPQRMDPSLPLVTDVFNDASYETAYFGKWHLGGHNNMTYLPREERGRFDVWMGYENLNDPYGVCIHGHDLNGRDDTDPLAEKLEGYETDALTDRLLQYLQAGKNDKPFFAVLSVTPPHAPYVADERYMQKHRPEDVVLRPNVPEIPRITEQSRRDLAGYYAQIENLDDNMGRVMDTLSELSLDQDTHVVFFSDHGDIHGSHGYRKKSSPWEESVRIPCIFRPAGGLEQGQTSDAPFNHVDFAPTTLGLCGIDTPDWMRGTNFSHHVLPDRKGSTTEPASAFLQHTYRKRFDCLNRVWRGVRTRDGWKYICLEGQPVMMFNLNEDPYELANLAFLDNFNEKRAELQEELAQWIARTGDSFTLPDL